MNRRMLLILGTACLALLIGTMAYSCSGDDDDNDDDDNDDLASADDDAADDDADDDTADDDTADDDNDTADDEYNTWYDSSTGLEWQIGYLSQSISYAEAQAFCDTLTLAGGYWRLPTISELRTLIRGCEETMTGGACGVTDSCPDYSCLNDSCDSCEMLGGPYNGYYLPSEMGYLSTASQNWSSSQATDYDNVTWVVEFKTGEVRGTDPVYGHSNTRCVRGGAEKGE